MFIASVVANNLANIAEVSGIAATAILPCAFWLRKHGRARVVVWFREALGVSDCESSKDIFVAAIHKEIKDIAANMYLNELAINARMDLRDEQANRLEASLRQLTAVMLRDPRMTSGMSENNGAS
jgi:hypothetical protein